MIPMIIVRLLDLYSFIVIASALISWFPVPHDNPIVRFLEAATEPVYRPIRSVINPGMLGGIDISPIIVLVVINIVKRALMSPF